MKHIQLPKLSWIKISSSHRKLLNHKQNIRIGTVTISKSVADEYFVSMQLGSDASFVEKKKTLALKSELILILITF